MVVLDCLSETVCAWSDHGRKHFPYEGMTREHTRHGPAVYLPPPPPDAVRDAIRKIEATTVAAPGHSRDVGGFKREYLRETAAVIGWDEGHDATASYVECSGGGVAGRSFHGRPINPYAAEQWSKDEG